MPTDKSSVMVVMIMKERQEFAARLVHAEIVVSVQPDVLLLPNVPDTGISRCRDETDLFCLVSRAVVTYHDFETRIVLRANALKVFA